MNNIKNIFPDIIEILDKPKASWLVTAIVQANVMCLIINLGFSLKATIVFLLLWGLVPYKDKKNHGSKVSVSNRHCSPQDALVAWLN